MVLRGWSCILEVHLEAQDDRLKLLPVDGTIPYRKHFQNLYEIVSDPQNIVPLSRSLVSSDPVTVPVAR